MRLQSHFWCIWGQEKVFRGCKCRPISLKRNPKIEADVVVSDCTVRYRAVAY